MCRICPARIQLQHVSTVLRCTPSLGFPRMSGRRTSHEQHRARQRQTARIAQCDSGATARKIRGRVHTSPSIRGWGRRAVLLWRKRMSASRGGDYVLDIGHVDVGVPTRGECASHAIAARIEAITRARKRTSKLRCIPVQSCGACKQASLHSGVRNNKVDERR